LAKLASWALFRLVFGKSVEIWVLQLTICGVVSLLAVAVARLWTPCWLTI
jgi:hypothetical protein